MTPTHPKTWLTAAAMATTLLLGACGGSGSDGDKPASPETRATAYGKVEGVNDSSQSGTYFWKGIPFAQPPVGELRWKAPRAPQAWGDTLQAKQFGPSCIQNPRLYSPGNNNTFDATVGDNLVSGHTPGSEDCLSLNIWRPATDDKDLPVIVFIHGGSNITGYSGDPLYDGAALAKKAGAVVVSANYRLGQLGFFRHPALRDEAADPELTAEDKSGNFAVLDIIEALKFVQGNIAEFGGDPNNVTLSGQSAGAINILAVLTATEQRSAGLFHKLAPLSGGISVATSPGFPQPVNDLTGNNGYIPALNPPVLYETLSATLLAKLLIHDGTAADVAEAMAWAAERSSAEIADYLRGKPASEILQVGLKVVGGLPNTTASGPIPEGTVVPEDPIAAIIAGDYIKVPVLSGLTRSESKLLSSYLPFVGYPAGIKLGDKALFDILMDPDKIETADFHDIINEAYPNGPAYDEAIDELDAKFLGALRDNYMDALAKQTPDQVWAYRFDWKQEAKPWDDVYGAAHVFDLPFLFGNFGPSLYANVINTEANRTGRLSLSDAMMNTLASFARSGDPNNAALGVQWPNWPSTLIFDGTLTNKLITVED